MPLLNAFVVDSDAFVADSDAFVVPANGSVNGMVCPGVPAPPYLRLPAHAHDVGIENVYWPIHTLVVLQSPSASCSNVINASIIVNSVANLAYLPTRLHVGAGKTNGSAV